MKSTVLGAKMGVTKVQMMSSLESKTLVREKTCMQITLVKALNCRCGSSKVLLKFRAGIRKCIMHDMAFVHGMAIATEAETKVV